MAIFDRIAEEYDQWYQSKLGAFVDQVETELAFSLFKPEPGIKILDVGCGTGNFSIKLAEMGCEVAGVDISDEMLEITRKKAKERGLDISFYNMDVYRLDFKENSFDGVFSMAAFEFIKEPKKAYDEMYRVLKPGGKMLIGTINKDSKWGELYLSRSVQETSVFQYADFKTMEDLKGLDEEKLVDSGECLFVPPDAAEDELNTEKERELSSTERGGYICALWKKEK